MKEIIVYTKSNCPACTQTKKWLQRNKIEYSEINVSVNTEAVENLKKLGYLSVPVVVAGEETWSGFNLNKLSSLKD